MLTGFHDSDHKYDVGGNLGIRGNPVTRTVVVDTGARDGGTAGGGASTELRPGTVLAPVTATGQYSDFDYDASDGTEAEADCVILLEKIDDISTGDQRALVAVHGGAFNWDKLRWATSTDKSNFARADANQFGYYNIT